MYQYYSLNRQLNEQKKNRIKVSGEGEIAIQPDMASIHLGIITESKELIPAQQQNSAASAKVINSLLSSGIKREDIQTFEYRIDPEYEFEEGKQIFRGYKITHVLKLKVENLSSIGRIIDLAVQNGANFVSNIQFTSSQKDAYYQQALTAAISNANEKAKTIAAALKVQLLLPPISIIEESTPIRPFESIQVAFAKGSSSTPIEPGQLIVKANITAKFLYQ